MRNLFVLALVAFSTSAAQAMPSPAQILAANRSATGGNAWNGKNTLTLDYAYSGQGLTGTMRSVDDLQRGFFIDSSAIGFQPSTNGFDGTHVWLKESSGTITLQGGGDTATLAINESYRDQNLWWRPDFGGATVVREGEKRESGRRFDVLTITPKGGKTFDAWFDATTHRLDHTVEVQGTLTMTTVMSDYAPVDGALIARKQVIDDGTGAANLQTITLTDAQFSATRPPADFAPPTEQPHDFAIEGSATRTTVPFKLINNHIYAQVSVNGSHPLQFIFDTGGHNILTPPTAEQLGVHAIGAATATGNGNSTAVNGEAQVRSIRIGDAVVTDQPVSVLQFGNPAEGVDEQGMIGYEFFARFVTEIDYGKHTLTFIDAKSFDPKDAGTPVSFRFYNQFPEILGSYDGIAGRFGIDTGARTPLSLNRAFAAEHNLRARAKSGVVALTGWGVGGPSRSFVTRGGALMLGDLNVGQPLTEFSVDTGGAGAAVAFPNNVGGGVLKRFVITLDYAHYRIFFKPIAGPVSDLDTFDRSGMWINSGKDGFEIVDVTKGGPAELAGLTKGDIITAVDGKVASGIALYDLRQRLRDDAPGTTVTFTIKSARGTGDRAVTLRDQV